MRYYQQNDKVKCINKGVWDETNIVGLSGIVINIDYKSKYLGQNWIDVEFDTIIKGDNPFSHLKGKIGHCWSCNPEMLELLKI